MVNRVEIIKIGELVRQPSGNIMIMVVEETDAIISRYISILRAYCEKETEVKYGILMTSGIIRGSGADNYKFPFNPEDHKKNMTGRSDGQPVIGKRYTIENGLWGTSVVEKIIDDNILITRNSVYAIHSLQSFRDIKLKDLGI